MNKALKLGDLVAARVVSSPEGAALVCVFPRVPSPALSTPTIGSVDFTL